MRRRNYKSTAILTLLAIVFLPYVLAVIGVIVIIYMTASLLRFVLTGGKHA